MPTSPTVHLWWSRPRLDLPADRLDVGARARCDALLHPDDRASFLSVRLLAVQAAADATGLPASALTIAQECSRCGGPHGQPRMAAGSGGQVPPSISWTRTRGFVAVAVATVPVGVDAEPADRRPPDPTVVLSPAERSVASALPAPERGEIVLAWWVRKEAVLKALGRGLHEVDPIGLEVPPPGGPDRVEPAHTGGAVLHVQDVAVADDVVVAVAVGTDAPAVVRVTEHSLAPASR